MEPFGSIRTTITTASRGCGAISTPPRGRGTTYSFVVRAVAVHDGFTFVCRGRGRDFWRAMGVGVTGQGGAVREEGASDGFVFDHYDHPDADPVVGAEEWGA